TAESPISRRTNRSVKALWQAARILSEASWTSGSLEDLQQNAAARIVSGRFHQGMSELSGLRATRSNDLTMPPASALKPLAKLRPMTLGRFSTSPGGT